MKTKSKYDTTPDDITDDKRSESPHGYYPNGEWAGFFISEEAATEWCKKEKGRTFNWVALPKPELRVSEDKKKVKRFTPKIPQPQNGVGRRKPKKTAVPISKLAESDSAERDMEWDVEDVKDDEKMETVAKKSQAEAIKKLTKTRGKKK